MTNVEMKEIWVQVRGRGQATKITCDSSKNIDYLKSALKAELHQTFGNVDEIDIIFRNADNDSKDCRISPDTLLSNLGGLGATDNVPLFVDAPPGLD